MERSQALEAIREAGNRGHNWVVDADISWAELLKRVYAIDVLQCDQCGGRMRILAVICQSATTVAILDCLGMQPQRPNSRAPPAADEFWGQKRTSCHLGSHAGRTTLRLEKRMPMDARMTVGGMAGMGGRPARPSVGWAPRGLEASQHPARAATASRLR